MKPNRKKVDTYRFNGDPAIDPSSIRPVTIADLETRIEKYHNKLADPKDPDDKKWIATWIKRYESELTKKRRALTQKERSQSQRPRPSSRECESIPPSSASHPAQTPAPSRTPKS
jgi:hypothetical protein